MESKCDEIRVSVLTGNSNSGSSALKTMLQDSSRVYKVKAGFRSENSAKEFSETYKDCGNFEVMVGVDADEVESMQELFSGSEFAIIVTPHDPSRGMQDDARLTANMINCAVDSGVKHIVYIGSWTVKDRQRISHIASRFYPSEQLLRQLEQTRGIKWTSLRCGFFNQNFIGMFKSLKNSNKIVFPKVYIPSVNTEDIGRSAAAIVRDSKHHHGKCYEISGPKMMSFFDPEEDQNFCKVFGKVLGREIEYEEKQIEQFKGIFPEYLVQVLEYMQTEGVNAIPLSDDVLKLTGQHSKFEDWLILNKHFFQ